MDKLVEREHAPRNPLAAAPALAVQFFLIPLIVVGITVLVYVGFRSMLTEERTPAEYLTEVRYGGWSRQWPAAYELSRLMEDPKVRADRSLVPALVKAFDEARKPFQDMQPLFELDRRDVPKMTRPLESLPAGVTRPQTMYILAWDPDKERLARVSMPFWMLRLGRKKIDLTIGGFDFQRLQLDIEQLERVGPIILFDYRPQNGQRVLVWTQ